MSASASAPLAGSLSSDPAARLDGPTSAHALFGLRRAPARLRARLRSRLRSRQESAGVAGATRDALLDVVVIASVLMFVLLMSGVGLLVLQHQAGGLTR